ncbi:MAG: D-glycero-alpha-D-manno-heptose-1,7-bisphosphate 7-phosphatase [Ginsengibacter sp.]
MVNLKSINKTWTLFLDRDGVINHEKKADYILNRDEFVFYDHVPESLKILSEIFGIIVIVTNQKGIGKKLMTIEDLDDIHAYMLGEIEKFGGRIDEIYYCSDLEDTSPNRKPNVGMAYQAQTHFNEIDFSKSLIAGNKLSDMQFGRNAGISTVFIATTNPETEFPHELIDFRFNSLYEFAKELDSLIIS